MMRRQVVTMAMGKLGLVSRLAGEPSVQPLPLVLQEPPLHRDKSLPMH